MAYLLNPYLGDVNPATADGLKLYNKAFVAPKTKLTLAQKHNKEILEHFELDSRNFDWDRQSERYRLTQQAQLKAS